MNFETLEQDVLQWAEARKIIPNSTPQTQLLKSLEEIGELAGATLKGNEDGIVDGVGDLLVTLIIYCALQNIDPIVCLASAYDTIRHRTGYLTTDGVFVKEVADVRSPE